jgi:hypothetical protein
MAYFKEIYERYQKATRCVKEKILDEYCKVCGYNRKYAIHKLNGTPPEDKSYAQKRIARHRQRPILYSSEAVKLLMKIWHAAGYPCSSRLKQIVALWMPWIEKHFCPSQSIQIMAVNLSIITWPAAASSVESNLRGGGLTKKMIMPTSNKKTGRISENFLDGIATKPKVRLT